MAKYTIKDFKVGDKVYHLSNASIKMVVIGIHVELNEAECRWLDKNGNVQVLNFFGEELGKADDLKVKFRTI